MAAQVSLLVALTTLVVACGATGPKETDAPVAPVVTAPEPEMPPPYIDDRELEARLVLAIGFNRHAEWREAKTHLDVLMQEWSGLWTVQLEFARALYRLNGDRNEVRSALEASIELRERNPRAWVMLGQLHEDQGELAEAERMYRTAVEQRSTDTAPQLALARVLRRDGRPDEAIDVLKDLVARRDRSGRTLLLLASAEEEAGRIDDAANTYRLAAVNHSDPLKGHIVWLRFLKRTGDVATATEVAATIERLRTEREGGRSMRTLRPSLDSVVPRTPATPVAPGTSPNTSETPGESSGTTPNMSVPPVSGE